MEKRLQHNIQTRKSNRLTIFDSIRNLPTCESPLPAVSEAKTKEIHRRLQLEKWKVEKEEKKKQQVLQKKKPFVTGVVRAPMKFEPPPPTKPSTSGRVTRSQTRSTILYKPKSPKKKRAQSFAPTNATFNAPHIKTLNKLPILAQPPKLKNTRKPIFNFQPIEPKATVKQSRSKNQTKQTVTEVKNVTKTRNHETWNNRQKTQLESKKALKSSKLTRNLQSSSSGSEVETSKPLSNASTTKSATTSETDSSFAEETSKSRKSIRSAKNNEKTNEAIFSPKPELQSLKSPISLILTPEQMESARKDPRVILSRGKAKATSEIRWKYREGNFKMLLFYSTI